MAHKLMTYEEYLKESKKEKKMPSPDTSNYPVPDACIVPPPGDKVTAHVKEELEKSKKKLVLYPAIVLDHSN